MHNHITGEVKIIVDCFCSPSSGHSGREFGCAPLYIGPYRDKRDERVDAETGVKLCTPFVFAQNGKIMKSEHKSHGRFNSTIHAWKQERLSFGACIGDCFLFARLRIELNHLFHSMDARIHGRRRFILIAFNLSASKVQSSRMARAHAHAHTFLSDRHCLIINAYPNPTPLSLNVCMCACVCLCLASNARVANASACSIMR